MNGHLWPSTYMPTNEPRKTCTQRRQWTVWKPRPQSALCWPILFPPLVHSLRLGCDEKQRDRLPVGNIWRDHDLEISEVCIPESEGKVSRHPNKEVKPWVLVNQNKKNRPEGNHGGEFSLLNRMIELSFQANNQNKSKGRNWQNNMGNGLQFILSGKNQTKYRCV